MKKTKKVKKMKNIIKTFIFVFLFLFKTHLIAQEIKDYDEIWDKIKASIDFEGSQVYSIDKIFSPNETISLLYGSINCPNNNSILIFLDDKPTAYWGHSCRYVFVNLEDYSTSVIKHLYPPKFLKEMSLLTPELKKREERLFDFSKIKTKVNSQKLSGNNYAVIISGGSETSFLNDCQAFYKTLTYYYGFTENNIYNLIGHGNAYTGYTIVNDYSATLENISMVFDELGGKMTSEDRLYVYVMDHGGPFNASEPDWNVFVSIYNGEFLPDFILAEELDKISSGKITTVIGSCNGGGFIDNLSKENRITISASRYDEEAWDNGSYGDFEKHFIAALIEQDLSGNTVDADINNDNYISIREAYYYAKDHDESEENPQYNSRPADLGKQLTMNNQSGSVNVPTVNDEWMPLDFDFTGEKESCNPLKCDPNNFPAGAPIWNPSHGSPKYYTTSQNLTTNDIYMEAEFISDYNNQKSEGIFLDFSSVWNPTSSVIRFNAGHKYNIKIYGDRKFEGVYNSETNNLINLCVVAANNLSSESNSDCELEEVPEYSDVKIIYNDAVPDEYPGNDGTINFNVTFDKDEHYEQLWIYAYQPFFDKEGGVILTNINITDKGINISENEEQQTYTAPSNINLICSDQEFTNSGDPIKLIGSSSTGTYQWQKRTESGIFTNIPGATQRHYDPPEVLETTYYRRVISDTDISNVVKITITIPPEPPCSEGKQIDVHSMSVSHGKPAFWNSDYMGEYAVLSWDFENNGLGTLNRVSNGIYSEYNFKVGSTYIITFYVQGKSSTECRDYLKIYAANGIGDGRHAWTMMEVPDYENREMIWEGRSFKEREKIRVFYTPDKDYCYIWIYPSQKEWKCIDRTKNAYSFSNLAIMADIILQPETITEINTTPFDGIDIYNSGATIINSGASLNLVASYRVKLKPGFQAKSGSNFNAWIDGDIYVKCPQKSGVIVNSSDFVDDEEEYQPESVDFKESNADMFIEQSFSIYPNPTKGIFNIDISGFEGEERNIQVYDISGKKIREVRNSNNTEEIDLSRYSSGLYFVRIIINDKLYLEKIIKQ